MQEQKFSLRDVFQMTFISGGYRAIIHAQRLLELVKNIDVGIEYDSFVLTLAAYLHDWGIFPRYAQTGVDHAMRSRQVAETEILPYMGLSASEKQIVLETIELHDYRDLRPIRFKEALLLREANMLEFLSVVDDTKEFTHETMGIETCYHRILYRRAGIQRRFILPRAREIAQIRLQRMDQCLCWLEEEKH